MDGYKEARRVYLAIAGRHEGSTPFVSAITGNFADFCPHLHDALHDTQRHIEVMSNLFAAFAEGEGLVDDPLLEVLRVVVLDRGGGLFARHGRKEEKE